jgi:hypothetical protein
VSPALLLSLLAAGPWADGRDPWSLLTPKLVNRELASQLDDGPRLGRALGPVDLAADVLIGTQIPGLWEGQSRFHGNFVVDGYAAVRVADGIDVNLNLLIFNYTASEPARFGSQIIPSVAVHLYKDLFELDGDPVRGDVLAVDLDAVTLGNGLLLEQIPLEGEQMALRWRHFELRHVFGGRVFWGDNLATGSLSAFDGRLGALYAAWIGDQSVSARDLTLSVGPRTDFVSHFVGGFARYDWADVAGVAVEYSARVGDGPARHALLLRGDLTAEFVGELRGHLGYQFRWYQDRFGPRRALEQTTTTPVAPSRESAYATNSFEYFTLSEALEQWSHTVMAEVRGRIGRHRGGWLGERLGLNLSIELLTRAARDNQVAAPRIFDIAGFGSGTGYFVRPYFRAGVEVYPWPELPHRVTALVTNKVVSPFRVEYPSSVLFADQKVLALTIEVFL